MEEKLLKCPNCGANATNNQNCEYCGSLLVRFVDKGIDLSKTSYTSNAEVFPGLIQHLQQNLRMQGTSTLVGTDVFRELGKQEKNSNGYVLSVIQTNICMWYDNQYFKKTGSNKGLSILLSFETILNDNDFQEFNFEEDARLSRFEQLESFSLFVPHTCYAKNQGLKRRFRQYAIDFGQDAEGAARLISEIIQKVYQIPLAEKIEILTNEGSAFEKARNEAAKARSGETDGGETNGGYAWWYIPGCILICIVSVLVFGLPWWFGIACCVLGYVVEEFLSKSN